MNEHSDSWNTETNTKLKEDKSDSYEIQIFRIYVISCLVSLNLNFFIK